MRKNELKAKSQVVWRARDKNRATRFDDDDDDNDDKKAAHKTNNNSVVYALLPVCVTHTHGE